ncbi:MAG: acetyl-CoA carboxylase carboxyltransferase subunit alpha [Anaerocolumna sp.]|nr:acetyl-CoA carboxylase carboxyltransferase subunit alpha [Anaerocolumna sp.]
MSNQSTNLDNETAEMARQEKSTWNNILSIRSDKRFKSMELADNVFTDFIELHGDRYFGDDRAIVGGLAYLSNIPVTVICQYKGKDLADSKLRQYGMPLPEGYRKALRLMKQAEKFNRPIICFIDTPGAFPGINAEERGQAEAIARNLYEMSALKVPVISVVISEGGSGGALALGVANKVFMLEKAIYSVVSPEGCASILWRDSKKASLASEHLKLTANDIYDAGIIDRVISEKGTFEQLCERLRSILHKETIQLQKLSGIELKEDRRHKFREIGNIKKQQEDVLRRFDA